MKGCLRDYPYPTDNMKLILKQDKEEITEANSSNQFGNSPPTTPVESGKSPYTAYIYAYIQRSQEFYGFFYSLNSCIILSSDVQDITICQVTETTAHII
jgi:hypothetical protein